MEFPRVNNFLDNLSSSAKMGDGGYSIRKLLAYAIILCVVVMHLIWLKRAVQTDNFTYLESILIADYSFVLGLLGLTTYSALREKKLKKEADAKV